MKRQEDADRVYPPPQFVVPLRDITQMEGGKIHFEARVEPVGDPTMYVEWFLNNRPLTASKWCFNSNLRLRRKCHITIEFVVYCVYLWARLKYIVRCI